MWLYQISLSLDFSFFNCMQMCAYLKKDSASFAYLNITFQ